MTNSDKKASAQATAAEKIDIICQHLEDDFGEQLGIRYRSSVATYASIGKECFPCEDDEKLEAIWGKTKQIIDAEKEKGKQQTKQNRFLELVNSIQSKNRNPEHQLAQRADKGEDNQPISADIVEQQHATQLDTRSTTTSENAAPEGDLSASRKTDCAATSTEVNDKRVQQKSNGSNAKRQYISDVIDFEEFRYGKINLIYAPCGCGKTTFIENKLRDYAKSIGYNFIYLAPTCALRDAFESRENKRQESEMEDSRTKRLRESGITAMTYAKFGYEIAKISEDPTQSSSIYYGKNVVICLDEMHQGVNQMYYSEARDNVTKTAMLELIKRAEDESNLVVAISATPKKMADFVFTHYHWKKTNINFIHSVRELKGYEPKETRLYDSSLESLIAKLNPSQRGLIYIGQISQIEKALSLFEEKGITAVGIWSKNNKRRMNDEQYSVAKSLIVDEKIPDNVQVLILNAAYQTGLNIDPNKTRLDYIVVHDSNKDVQTQVLGRYRGDIDVAYLRITEQDEHAIPQSVIEPYLNRKLFKEDKDNLCEAINITDKQGRLCKWPTIKKLLKQQRYRIEEGKSGNRYSLIKPPEKKIKSE